MKLVIQRVKNASVEVDKKIVGKIEKGFLVLIGIKVGDTKEQADYLVRKLCNLRVFSDENDKMNLSLKDVAGQLLIVSQFTLYGDCSDGNRPSFIEAARPDEAIPLYEYFCNECARKGLDVQKGIFGADMKVQLLNDGPVTIISLFFRAIVRHVEHQLSRFFSVQFCTDYLAFFSCNCKACRKLLRIRQKFLFFNLGK